MCVCMSMYLYLSGPGCMCVLLGANIFLTLKGSVKLGDFGCSVKLKSHTTMPGELMTNAGAVGTPG